MIAKPRLSNQIYEWIRDELRSGKYTSDTRFTEPGLAEELNTSRTPVREALFQLVSNGLLCEYDRGYGLPKLSRDDVEKIMELRIALETLAIEKLCPGISDAAIEELSDAQSIETKNVNKKDVTGFILANNQFRKALYSASGNDHLQEIAELLSDRLQIYRVLTMASKQIREYVAREHGTLVEALERDDADTAVSVHVRMLENATRAYVECTEA